MRELAAWTWAVPGAPREDTTHRLGMDWLAPCRFVEDWGCGDGYARRYRDGKYLGIDGTPGQGVDWVADLRRFRSHTNGIFMRHVLEHNWDWQLILANLLGSFTYRAAVVTFTPFAAEVTDLAPGARVPDLAFVHDDLAWIMGDLLAGEADLQTDTQYGTEHIFYLEKL